MDRKLMLFEVWLYYNLMYKSRILKCILYYPHILLFDYIYPDYHKPLTEQQMKEIMDTTKPWREELDDEYYTVEPRRVKKPVKIYKTQSEEFGGVQKEDFDVLLIIYGALLAMLISAASLIYLFFTTW